MSQLHLLIFKSLKLSLIVVFFFGNIKAQTTKKCYWSEDFELVLCDSGKFELNFTEGCIVSTAEGTWYKKAGKVYLHSEDEFEIKVITPNSPDYLFDNTEVGIKSRKLTIPNFWGDNYDLILKRVSKKRLK